MKSTDKTMRGPARRAVYGMIGTAIMASLAFSSAPVAAQQEAVKPPSAATKARNEAERERLPFADKQDFEEVRRGLVAPFREPVVAANGAPVWNMGIFDFLDADKNPDSVHPSLWRMARLNANAGLYRLTDRVYQLRGFDLANMTIIEGDSGIVVVDPLMTVETARAALAFYRRHRPPKPVVAVIYTHSHLDHFGGVRGVIDEAEVKAGRVRIYAPLGFLQEAVSENIFAGNAMLRRGQFQAGTPVARGERGQIDMGIGKAGSGVGTATLIAPTDIIGEAYENRRIDGIEFEFQLASGTEAPAEMNFYLPQMRALCMSEVVTRTMHNLLTPRGAQVRDSKAWSRIIDEALIRYGDRADVMFASHNWPSWGRPRIEAILADERDLYAYMNDRTLHLLNQGKTPEEIGEAMKELPPAFAGKWYLRGYYGTPSFNARAVYQRYLGFYDANPANLDPLPPVDAGKRYVAAMGGEARVRDIMRTALEQGDYRWAVEIGNHLLFADPDNAAARALQADALEQLGYQAESALWRNMYLTGATELREGVRKGLARNATDMVRALEPAMYFDLMGVRLDFDRAQGHDMTLNWRFPDVEQLFALTLRGGVLTYRQGVAHARPDATIVMDKATLDRLNLKQIELATALRDGSIRTEGNGGKLAELLGLLVTFDPSFAIVTP